MQLPERDSMRFIHHWDLEFEIIHHALTTSEFELASVLQTKPIVRYLTRTYNLRRDVDSD